MVQGFPKAIEFEGMSWLMKELGAMRTFDPIVILPTITALTPIQTLSPMVGTPFRGPRFSCPIVTPLWMLQFLPILTCGFIVMQNGCPM